MSVDAGWLELVAAMHVFLLFSLFLCAVIDYSYRNHDLLEYMVG